MPSEEVTQRRKEMGGRIRKARTTSRLSQAELAAQMHTSSVTVSRWESGTSPVTGERLNGLALALGVSPKWLLNGSPDPLPAILTDLTHAQRQDERIRELEEAVTFHLETIEDLKKDLERASYGNKCHDSKCLMAPHHAGSHYDGQRRYYVAGG